MMLEIAAIIGGGVVALFLLTVLVGAPYVPTHGRQFRQLLDKLQLDRQRDVLVDLGSGDGQVIRLAAGHVKRAVGYEINPVLLAAARWRTRHQPSVELHLADFRRIQLPTDTTVVYIFSAGAFLDQVMKLLQNHLTITNQPLTVISYGFELNFEIPVTVEIEYGFYIYKFQKDYWQKNKK